VDRPRGHVVGPVGALRSFTALRPALTVRLPIGNDNELSNHESPPDLNDTQE
jgi:hypothetical protein